MAEEVHFLYPSGEWALARAKGKPMHEFFKKYGEAVPEADWNHPGTKQGVYMIGPNAEYLDGAGSISGSSEQVRRRLQSALKRWAVLSKEKGYANKPVPTVDNVAVPNVADKALVLRVFLRDLPRGGDDDSGRRFSRRRDVRGRWLGFTEWAWNINWFGIDDPGVLVPQGREPEAVGSALFRRICREVLVDNVRGQTPVWRDEAVELAELTMQRLPDRNGRWHIEYRGRAAMSSGELKFAPSLYGRGVWDPKAGAFDSVELVAIGPREGAAKFNQRDRDRGPAPMGVALVQYQPPR